MNKFNLKIGEKLYTATSPKMKTLKIFLKAKGDGDNITFTSETLDALDEVLMSIFPKLTAVEIEQMEISDYMKTFEDLAAWIGSTMGTKEKN